MTQRYIFDGYNFIHKIPALKKAMLEHGPEAGRRALEDYLYELAPALGVKSSQFLVVYDGSDTVTAGERGGRIRSLFSRGGADGDEYVIRQVRGSKHPERLVVVSDDNHIANNVRVHGAKIIRAGELLALVAKRGRSRPARSGRGVEDKKVVRNAGKITKELAREWEVEM